MKTTIRTPLFNPNILLAVAADVSKDKSNYACETGGSLRECEVSNARADIIETLQQYRSLAKKNRYEDAVLIVEPTGGYERPLCRAARAIGMKVFYVNTEAVSKLQVLQDGTASKSDRKDPRTILTVAKVGGLMRCRDLSGRWQALRQMNAHHDRLETELSRLKNVARKLIHELIPGLDFCSQWFFQKAAMTLARLYRFNPYAMENSGFPKAAAKLRKAKILKATVQRVTEKAELAVQTQLDPIYVESVAREIEELYERIESAAANKQALETRFEAIYDELLENGEAAIEPVGGVLTKARLAMIHGETGPLDDFQSIRQLRKYAGMNIRLNDSGAYSGQRRISKKGRALLRKILTQGCLPLVSRKGLFAKQYKARRDAGSPGKKAMVAIANKYLDMIFGLHRSATVFNPERVFASHSEQTSKAA